MGKLLLLLLLVTVLKCNGQFPGIGNIVPSNQKQVQGALGFATSILGGISSGIGFNVGGQLGFNNEKRPGHHYNGQYEQRPQKTEETVSSTDYYVPPKTPQYSSHHYQQQSPPHVPQIYHNPHQHSSQHYGKPGGHGHGQGNQGLHPGYPNQHGNEYNNNNNFPHKPIRPGQTGAHHGGNYNNNGNYANDYPNNQHLGNNHGHHHEHHHHQSGNFNKPGHGSNNFNDIFGNIPQHDNVFSSGTQNPNTGVPTGNQNLFNNNLNNKPSQLLSNQMSTTFNVDKVTEKPEVDLPTFVPLAPVDTKRESDTEKPTTEEEDFEIDIRFKDQ